MPDSKDRSPAPLVAGVDYYSKCYLFVFTSAYHLNRGYCCGMGCAHCPYDYESVPEPLRSQLHEKEKNNKSS